jgi:hypothetical protein
VRALEHALAERAQAAAPLLVHLARLGAPEQLDLQPVERHRHVALARDLLEQPVGQLVGPGGGVEVVAAQAVGDRGDAGDLAAGRPAQRRDEDVGLGGEVPRRRGERDVGFGGHAAMGDGGDTLAGDDPHGGGHDRLAHALGSLCPRPGGDWHGRIV